MKGFEPVTLTWRGASYEVPAERQLMLVAQIEDVLRGNTGRSALDILMQKGGPGIARMSQAFGAALRFAGSDVSDEEIYLSIHKDLAEQNVESLLAMQGATLALIGIISPPVAMALRGEDDGEKKDQAAD